MSNVSAAAVFQVCYPDDTPQPDLLGLWQAERLDASFSVGGETPGVVWRVNLPEDPLESARLLGAQSLSLVNTTLALDAAGPLLSRDLQRAAAGDAGHVAFDLSVASAGRYDLLTQALYAHPGSVSFDLRDELSEAAQTVSNFAVSVQRLVDRFALVESSRGGATGARTRLDWLGDVHTWWLAGSPPPVISRPPPRPGASRGNAPGMAAPGDHSHRRSRQDRHRHGCRTVQPAGDYDRLEIRAESDRAVPNDYPKGANPMSNGTTTDLATALKKAGEELAKQISDASELQVETKWVLADEKGDVDWNAAKPAARTTIKLDGDSELIVPMSKEGDTLVVRKDLLALHEANVANARAYREKLYDMIYTAAKELGGR